MKKIEKKEAVIDKQGNIIWEKINKKKITSSTFNYLDYINVGYYVIAPLLFGVFLGVVIDKWLNKKPIFTLIFIFFGAVSSIYNLFKLTKEKDAKDQH